MKIEKRNNTALLQSNKLLHYNDIVHFSSTKKGGVSKNYLTGLNLGFSVEDKAVYVRENRNILANALDIEYKQLVFPKQTHSLNVAVVKSLNDIFPETDALITNMPGICICIQTADCVPVLLYDKVKKAIAAIHSGWKGTLGKISEKAIKAMSKHFGTQACNIIALIGPSIGPGVYEVGKDVSDLFLENFKGEKFLKVINNSDKALLNLWELNKKILAESGIPEHQIEVSGMCTFSNPDYFYSARRDGIKTGRMASGIMLKP